MTITTTVGLIILIWLSINALIFIHFRIKNEKWFFNSVVEEIKELNDVYWKNNKLSNKNRKDLFSLIEEHLANIKENYPDFKYQIKPYKNMAIMHITFKSIWCNLSMELK